MNPVTTELIRENGRVVEIAENGRRRPVIRDENGRIIGVDGPSAVDELAGRIDMLAAGASEATARIVASIEGWVPAAGLLISTPGVARAAARLDIRWPIDIAWMSPEDQAEKDSQWSGEVGGYRAASNTRAHTIVLRVGNSASRTAGTIRHELGHCRQCELLGDLFDATYLADDGVALERQAREAAETVADVELVRPAETRSTCDGGPAAM